MNKFRTVKEIADIEEVTESYIYEKVKNKEYLEINIKQDLPKLLKNKSNSKAEIISFMNLKGGAGKTTISVNFAVLLSKLGLKVLIIDTDHQNHVRLFFQEIKYEHSIVDLFTKPENVDDYIYSSHSGASIVDVIYSSHELPFIINDIKNEHTLKNAIEPLIYKYDFIIIDTPPAFDLITINCAKASTGLIIPLKPEPMHYEGMNHYIGALVMQDIPKENIKGMVFNQAHERIAQHKAYIEILREQYKSFCYETVVPFDPHIPKTNDILMGVRTNIFDFKEKAKSSQAIKKLTWEILRSL